MERDFKKLAFGEAGHVILTSAAADATQAFSAIQILADASIDCKAVNSEDIVGLALAAGTVIYGVFTELVVNSGSVIAYKRQ